MSFNYSFLIPANDLFEMFIESFLWVIWEFFSLRIIITTTSSVIEFIETIWGSLEISLGISPFLLKPKDLLDFHFILDLECIWKEAQFMNSLSCPRRVKVYLHWKISYLFLSLGYFLFDSRFGCRRCIAG